jgi:ankyrin repeat protein
MPASLLYQMFKEKTEYPLHTAIKARREDVVFLYFIENDATLRERLNQTDHKDDLPLDLALRTQQESIAKSLIKHQVDINKIDARNGLSLLHKAIKRDDVYSARFLVANGISVNLQSNREDKSRTALMYLAANADLSSEMLDLARKILSAENVNVNLQDSEGNTSLHIAIGAKNKAVFKEILLNSVSRPNFTLMNKNELTVLWQALLQSEESSKFDIQIWLLYEKSIRKLIICADDFEDMDSFPSLLISRGCELNTTDSNGDSLLHLCARSSLENACIFLVNKEAETNSLNDQVSKK